jgi:hypothetical protein
MNREIKTEVKTYKVDILCSICDGVMHSTGVTFLTNPQKFEHKCTKCDYKESFIELYPTIKYE